MNLRIDGPGSTIRSLLLGACVLFSVASADACVGCREAGSQTMAKEHSTVLAGIAFSWSVLFMLFIVLSIVAAMSLYIWQTCRRVDRGHRPG